MRIAVLPASPGGFDALCERGSRVAEEVGAGGGPTEWLIHGDRWVFAPTWSLDDPAGIEAAAARFGALGAVYLFLGEEW